MLGIFIPDTSCETSAIHQIKLKQRPFIANGVETGGGQGPSGIQIFQEFGDSSELHHEIYKVVDRHIGDGYSQIFEGESSSYGGQVDRMPCFNHGYTVNYRW